MSDNDDNRARSIAVLIILLIVVGAGAMIWLTGGADGELIEPEPVREEVVEPEPASAPEPWVEPAPEIIPAPESEPEPDVITPDPVVCMFPGDGFVQTPHGFVPTSDYVAFDPPQYLSGYAGIALPMAEDDTGEACVMLLYDISAEGEPVNIRALDVQPAGIDSAAYEVRAISALETRRYVPGSRNRKPVRIDNNFLEVRFSGNSN